MNICHAPVYQKCNHKVVSTNHNFIECEKTITDHFGQAGTIEKCVFLKDEATAKKEKEASVSMKESEINNGIYFLNDLAASKTFSELIVCHRTNLINLLHKMEKQVEQF